jgi:POT family proton-dependent oligopeptide transporter
VRRKFAEIPDGAGVLFFIQVFATLGFAVLYSTLVLYSTNHLHFSTKEATAMMGVFGAFNYGLHLFGGYLGGRFLSNRNLFVGGMILQVLGCAAIAGGSTALLYLGLALFLTGSGLNVTCINMMLTQRFKPDDVRREAAFLWNYAGMNVGFFVGFTAAGHFQLTERYTALFIFATVGNFIAVILAGAFWKTLEDRDTPLREVATPKFKLRFAGGIGILVGLVPVVWFLLQHPHGTETLVKAISAVVFLSLAWLAFRHRDTRERNNMWAYLILTVGSLVFWALYQMAPSGLQLFAVNNVNRKVWGVEVAPQWIQNINTVVIVIGGPLMSALFTKLRARGWNIDIPKQFAASLALMGLGFVVLPLGIKLAGGDGMVAFSWLFLSYVLQSVGELLISPVGYAMIGKLAPRQHQGVMMGAWMLVTGLASLFAGDFSGMVPEPSEGSAVATNPVYSTLFMELGLGSLAVGVVLMLLIPALRKLITDGAEAMPAERPVAVNSFDADDAPATADEEFDADGHGFDDSTPSLA